MLTGVWIFNDYHFVLGIYLAINLFYLLKFLIIF